MKGGVWFTLIPIFRSNVKRNLEGCDYIQALSWGDLQTTSITSMRGWSCGTSIPDGHHDTTKILCSFPDLYHLYIIKLQSPSIAAIWMNKVFFTFSERQKESRHILLINNYVVPFTSQLRNSFFLLPPIILSPPFSLPHLTMLVFLSVPPQKVHPHKLKTHKNDRHNEKY
jgi:hypothetical protein